MNDFSNLAEKATWSKLSQKEIEQVEETFYNCMPGNDAPLANCIYILGRIAAIRHKPTIEKYLYYPSDPQVSQIALKILCIYWKETANYIEQIVSFIKGQPWDTVDEVRLMAFHVLGRYLQNEKTPKLLKLLIDFVVDPTSIEGYFENRDYARSFLQACAYVGLGTALDIPMNDIPDEDEVELLIKEGHAHSLPFIQQARAYLRKYSI